MTSILYTLKGRIRHTKLVALALAPLLYTSSARAECPVEAGDVIEVSIGGMMEVHERAAVQPDGTVTFPQVGTVSVAGLSSAEIRARVRAALLGKPIRQRSPDGRAIPITIEPDDVAASIVEYRPIYVMGDVSKPGQYAFRPAMTAGQAVALSGGYDLWHEGHQRPLSEVSDVQSEFDAVMAQLAALSLRETRLKAELGDLQDMNDTLPPDVQVSPATLSGLFHAEYEIFKTRRAQFQAEKGYLERSLKQAQEFQAALNEQLKQEGHGALADARELEDLRGLQGKGFVSIARISETRHAVLLSENRKLQINMELDRARQKQEESQKQLAQLQSERKIALLDDLRNDTVRLIELRTKLTSASDKLAGFSLTRAQAGRGAAPSPKLVVVRKAQKGRERLSVDDDFELQPADVVEVALVTDDLNRHVAARSAPPAESHLAGGSLMLDGSH